MAYRGPFFLWSQYRTEIERLGSSPRLGSGSSGRVMFDDFLKSTADYSGGAHFIFASESLGLTKERIGHFHLYFYHDGILPTRLGCVNFSARTSLFEHRGRFVIQAT